MSATIVLIPYVALTSGVTICALDTALKELPGQTTAILSYIDPLVAIILSVFVLDEHMTVVQVIGGVLILGFTLWNEISSKKYEGVHSV